MILTIGGRKGGVGKTTLAINLTSALTKNRREVLLFDADRQENSAEWARRRFEHKGLSSINCVQGYDNIVPSVLDLAKRYDDIIIDTPGRDSKEFRYSLGVADMVLLPVKCSVFDLETLPYLNEILEQSRPINHRFVAMSVISMGTTNPLMKEIYETADKIKNMKENGGISEINHLSTVVSDRVAFRNTLFDGMSIFESTDEKACGEIKGLLDEILSYDK